jgi:transcriptional regulator with XRE-family HTH domain
MIQNGSRGFLVVTVEQIRAARGLLGWSQTELATRAGLSLPTVKRVEAGMGPRVSDEARARIQKALETGGAQFISENGGGPGVRLRRPRQSKKKPKT